MSVAALIAIASAFALRRVWQRPSNERLFAGLALAMPVTGYLSHDRRCACSTTHADGRPVAAILGIIAIVMLIAGIAWRDRVLLISATLSIACAAIELRDLFDYPAEAKLIGAGIAVIAIAVTLERALRTQNARPRRHRRRHESVRRSDADRRHPHRRPARIRPRRPRPHRPRPRRLRPPPPTNPSAAPARAAATEKLHPQITQMLRRLKPRAFVVFNLRNICVICG